MMREIVLQRTHSLTIGPDDLRAARDSRGFQTHNFFRETTACSAFGVGAVIRKPANVPSAQARSKLSVGAISVALRLMKRGSPGHTALPSTKFISSKICQTTIAPAPRGPS